MSCEKCDLSINSCLSLCDGRCLANINDCSYEQLYALCDSQYYKANLPLINIFFQRKAPMIIKNMFSSEKLMLICIAVYKDKISEKNMKLARSKSKRVNEALDATDIKNFILTV